MTPRFKPISPNIKERRPPLIQPPSQQVSQMVTAHLGDLLGVALMLMLLKISRSLTEPSRRGRKNGHSPQANLKKQLDPKTSFVPG